MPYNNMITKQFTIREDFSSITFNQDSAQSLADRLLSIGGKYSINGITVAFPLAGYTHYPLRPEDYPLSGVPVNDVPSKEVLASLSPKILIEPRLFHLTGDNIDLVVVQQDYTGNYSYYNLNESHLEVDETYLKGRISLPVDSKSTESKLAFISTLERLIRKYSNVQKDESSKAAYDAHSASLIKR